MLPLIRPHQDVVVLRGDTGELHRYDVVLYKRKNGSYILHRILDINPKEYIMCGDNQFVKEHGIQRDQILGVMEGFYRGEKKYISVRSRGYRVYTRIWCFSLRLRRAMLFGMRVGRKIKRCFQREA